MAVQRVKITKDGAEATCMPAAVPAWERNGWTVADDGSSEETSTVPEPKPVPEKTTTRKAAD